ncbi:hypothetical protein RCS94_03580 [Orbaceae bacterium ac157xtp]
MINQTGFSIVYGGDAYSDNQIDAKTLGNALSSLAALIEHSDKLLNGEDASPQLIIKAHKEGSFEIICEVVGASLNTLQALGLNIGAATAIGSIWAALDIIRGKKIAAIDTNKRTGISKLTVDNIEIECTEDVKKLLISPVVRKEIDQLVYQPLQTENPSFFKLKSDGQQPLAEIEQDSAKNFKRKNIVVQHDIETEEREVNINFAKVNFSSKRGWSIILPDQEQVNVSMNDENFLERVNTNQTRFSKDDLFVVLLRTETIKEDDIISKVTYSIDQVIRHRAAEERRII